MIGSSKAKRVQITWRRKGGKKPPNTVVVARPSKWGNPCLVGSAAAPTREIAVAKYRHWLDGGIVGPEPPTRAEIKQHLRGKDLACYCPLDAPCHADVLLEIANEGEG